MFRGEIYIILMNVLLIVIENMETSTDKVLSLA